MKKKKKLVYIGPVEGYEEIQANYGNVLDIVRCREQVNEVSEELKDAAGLLDASMKVQITNDMVSSAILLEIIATATTGSDHIDRVEANNRSIPIRTLREDNDLLKNITPAAELTWALLVALATRLNPAVSHVKSGEWDRQQFPSIMLNGKVLGIIGCGRIGQWMARYGKAFGMQVIGYDPKLESWPDNILRKDLQTVMMESDFVSIHVHLSPETTGLISRELLNLTKIGVFLINTSRGQVLDEGALLDGLISGHIGGAGLDVLTGEPLIANHPLVEYAKNNSNLLITPHCGGYSPDAVRIVCKHAAEKVVQYIV